MGQQFKAVKKLANPMTWFLGIGSPSPTESLDMSQTNPKGFETSVPSSSVSDSSGGPRAHHNAFNKLFSLCPLRLRTLKARVSSAFPIQKTPLSCPEKERPILVRIPTEIICLIASFLPPSSLMSFQYSCHEIHYKIGTPIDQVLGIKSRLHSVLSSTRERITEDPVPSRSLCCDFFETPIVEPTAHHTERLELLCMLDRDQKFSPSRAICSGCADTHDRSRFSEVSLRHCSRQRICLGKAGRIWLCPHRVFDYTQYVAYKNLYVYHQCGQNEISINLWPRGVQISWPVIVLDMDNFAPSKRSVEAVLAPLSLPICRHLRFNDPFISGLYSPDCERLRLGLYDGLRAPKCYCSSCSWQRLRPESEWYYFEGTGGWCENCKTFISFRIRRKEECRPVLQLVVQRRLKDFRDCTDDAWIEQVSDPADFHEFEQAWYAATRDKIESLPRSWWVAY